MSEILKIPAPKLESPTYYRAVIRCIDQVADLFRFIGKVNASEWRGHEAGKWIVSGFDVGLFFGSDGKKIEGYFVNMRVGHIGDDKYPVANFSDMEQALPALSQIPESVA